MLINICIKNIKSLPRSNQGRSVWFSILYYSVAKQIFLGHPTSRKQRQKPSPIFAQLLLLCFCPETGIRRCTRRLDHACGCHRILRHWVFFLPGKCARHGAYSQVLQLSVPRMVLHIYPVDVLLTRTMSPARRSNRAGLLHVSLETATSGCKWGAGIYNALTCMQKNKKLICQAKGFSLTVSLEYCVIFHIYISRHVKIMQPCNGNLMWYSPDNAIWSIILPIKMGTSILL